MTGYSRTHHSYILIISSTGMDFRNETGGDV